MNFSTEREMKVTDYVFRAMEAYNVPQGITPDEAWEKFSNRLVHAEKNKLTDSKKKGLSPWLNGKTSDSEGKSIPISQGIISRIAVAATIAILLAAGYLMKYELSDTVMESSYGERISVELPDGSGVTLNSGSKITFNANTWKKDRKTYLEGEAYFEVTEGSSFRVLTDNAETRVLGTSFNVYARNNELKVVCYTGSVEVLTNSGDYAILKPGYYIHGLKDKITELKNEAKPSMNSWINGEFYFHNEPLLNVFAEMERQFNIRVDYTEVTRRSYSGYFNNRSLTAALDLVCIPMQLNYKIFSGNRIHIYN